MDVTASHIVLSTAHQMYARANTTADTTQAIHSTSDKVIGLVLALASGLFIGVSFVLKKMGLLKANKKYNQEAGEGYGYLKNAWWWTGMTLMILGEICNFAAYLFTDPILVTPLGALSVVVTAILSGIFLKERLSFVGKIGCFDCIVGAVVIAINAPEQSAVNDINGMKDLVRAPGFLVYLCVVIAICVFVALYLGPKYGKRTMMVHLTVCSLIGGLSVSGIQGIGAAIKTQAKGIPQFNNWFLYVLLIFIIVTLVTEIIYLNKALNLFNAALVTPTYYVYFTSAVIVTSAVLYQGFKGTPIQIVTVVFGFLQICSGVVLLQLSKSAKDVPDTAVFNGDVDQIRTIAEQEEPEYEPRADAIRGSSAIIRSLSKARQSKQLSEIERLREDLSTIGENEEVTYDGIRRRRTVSGEGGIPALGVRRSRTLHPPLGMSHFPEEDDEHHTDHESDYHPGIFHFRRKHRSMGRSSRASHASSQHGGGPSVQMDHLKTPDHHEMQRTTSADSSSSTGPHIYGLPPGLKRPANITETQDTSYYGAHGPHIQFASDLDRPSSRNTNISARSPNLQNGAFPPPPPIPESSSSRPSSPREANRRQFSFHNVFSRSRPNSAAGGDPSGGAANSSRGISFSRKSSHQGRGGTDGTTEEERLGLVKGDSTNTGTVPNVRYSVDRYRQPSVSPSASYSDLESAPGGLASGAEEGRTNQQTDYTYNQARQSTRNLTGNDGNHPVQETKTSQPRQQQQQRQQESDANRYSIRLGQQTRHSTIRQTGGSSPSGEDSSSEEQRDNNALFKDLEKGPDFDPARRDGGGGGSAGAFI